MLVEQYISILVKYFCQIVRQLSALTYLIFLRSVKFSIYLDKSTLFYSV